MAIKDRMEDGDGEQRTSLEEYKSKTQDGD